MPTGPSGPPTARLIVFQERDDSTLSPRGHRRGGRRRGEPDAAHELRPDAEVRVVVPVPELRAGWRLDPLPHAERRPENDPNWDLWSVPVAGGEPTIVRRNAGWGDYSPDGQTLAYVSHMGEDFTGDTLSIVSVDGGTPTPVAAGQIGWPRWSPDGTQISFHNGGSIFVLNVATGSTTKDRRRLNAEWADDHTLIIGPGGQQRSASASPARRGAGLLLESESGGRSAEVVEAQRLERARVSVPDRDGQRAPSGCRRPRRPTSRRSSDVHPPTAGLLRN